MTTDQHYNRNKPWSDSDAAMLRRGLEVLVTNASPALGRTRFGVQCQLMKELGVSQKEIERIRRSRQRRGPLGKLANWLWEVSNHQVVGGVLLAVVLGLLVYRYVPH